MVTIWGRPGCSWCDEAREICVQYNIKYEYISADTQEKIAELRELVPGVKTVPQIFWNNRYIGGYEKLAEEIENTRNFGQETL